MKFDLNWYTKPKCSIATSQPGLYLQWAGAHFWVFDKRENQEDRIKYLVLEPADKMVVPFSFGGWSGIYEVSDYYGNEILPLSEVREGKYVHVKSGHVINVVGTNTKKKLTKFFNCDFILEVESNVHESYETKKTVKKLKIPNTCAKGLFKFYKAQE